MTEPIKPKASPQTAAPAAPAASHLVILDDIEGFKRGAVIPNTPELAEKLGPKARHATAFDLGVAGIVTRKV